MPSDSSFARLVSLACHDLRTPLATVHGFARTLDRIEPLSEQTLRYIEMIASASAEMAELLDLLGVVARIESGRYDPPLMEVDSLELARTAAEHVTVGDVDVEGDGSPVMVDREGAERSVAAFATCALRHGGAERVTVHVDGTELRLAHILEAGPVLLGDELRDLGAAGARRLVEALGGSVAVDGDSLVVELPTSAAATGAGP